jgi:ABC-type sugar transport system ATPase subunit
VLKLVRELQANGAAVVLASTEPELVLAHADRVLVLRKGRVTAEFSDVSLDKQTLMSHA